MARAKKRSLPQRRSDIIDSYFSLDYMTVDALIEKLQAAKAKYGEKYENLRVEIETEYGYYNDVSISYCLMGDRIETEAEAKERWEKEEAQRIQAETWQRHQYEQLKKKFEKG